MDLTLITTLEIIGVVSLSALLIAAAFPIGRYNKILKSDRMPAQNYIIPLLAGLAMLDFIMINLLVADILDPNHNWTYNVLITVLILNLPLAIGTIWTYRKTRQT